MQPCILYATELANAFTPKKLGKITIKFLEKTVHVQHVIRCKNTIFFKPDILYFRKVGDNFSLYFINCYGEQVPVTA